MYHDARLIILHPYQGLLAGMTYLKINDPNDMMRIDFNNWLLMLNSCSRFHCSEMVGYQNQRFHAYWVEAWIDSFEVHPDSWYVVDWPMIGIY